MNAQMTVKMYSSFTWGPIHIGGVEGTSRSGVVSGGWNNRTIQTSSITTETRNSGSTTVRQGEVLALVLLPIAKGQNGANQGNWTLALQHHPWHTTDLTPTGTDKPTGDKKLSIQMEGNVKNTSVKQKMNTVVKKKPLW